MKKLAMWVGLIIFFTAALPAFSQQIGADLISPTADLVAPTAEEYFNKGVELYETQNYKEAVTAFEKAIEIKPDYAEAYYNLGITYWQQKQYKKVLEKLQKVIEVAPGSDSAKKAEQDIKNLKIAGIYSAKPADGEEEGEEKVYVKTEPSEKPNATLPELTEDLRFGPKSKRLAAAKELGLFPQEKAVETLGEVAGTNGELPEIRMAALESLGKIALPSAIPFLQSALETPDLPAEGKQTAIKALNTINTAESLKVILSSWSSGSFPGGLSDQSIVNLVRKKGREGFADIIRPAYLQTVGEKKTYMALALGILKDTTGVPLMVNRLKEDYPGDEISPSPKSSFTQPVQQSRGPRDMAGPGVNIPAAPTPILKEKTAESGGWSRKDEIGLRTEITKVLGVCAGANQKPFLIYLSKNDREEKVKEAALEAVENLESRITSSTEAYQKGAALVKEGKTTEAIPLIQTALKDNPDAPYAEEIKKLQARFNYDRALVLLRENKKEEAVALLQSALELDPGATYRKDAEDKLAELQISTTAPAPAPPTPVGVPPTKPGTTKKWSGPRDMAPR